MTHATLTIDIQRGIDQRWYVIADDGAGLMHDAFATQAEAITFARTFYGGTVQPIGKPKASKPACSAPRIATAEAIAKYGTTYSRCTCPDRAYRGGSCYDERTREQVCHHMLTVRTQQRVLCAQAIVSREPAMVDDGLAGFFGYSHQVAV